MNNSVKNHKKNEWMLFSNSYLVGNYSVYKQQMFRWVLRGLHKGETNILLYCDYI